ncbi:MAG TPA: hypothetical protein VE076_06825 [Nitrososphaeraceae archaeon]|nr:hypothetical protein [Nitrososphaeraceae archaeon]
MVSFKLVLLVFTTLVTDNARLEDKPVILPLAENESDAKRGNTWWLLSSVKTMIGAQITRQKPISTKSIA